MIAFYENRMTELSLADRTAGTSKLRCSPHLHRHIELVLLMEGETVGYADAECTTFYGGDAFLVFPNQVHRFQSLGPEKYYLFIVDPDSLPGLSEAFDGVLPATARIEGAARDPEILQLAARAVELRSTEDFYEKKALSGYLMALFARLLSQLTFHKTAPEDSRALKEVVDYCIRHYTEELSLSLLEEKLHISKYYISHLFSDKLQIGFNDYVNSLRISNACRYLRGSDKSVTEIGELVGFGTSRTFNRAFIKQMGRTPSEYRRRGDQKTDGKTEERTKKHEADSQLFGGSRQDRAGDVYFPH